MSPATTWYSLEEAVAKFSLDTSTLLKWAEDGVVRSEHPDTRCMRIKADDLERKLRNVNNVDLAFRDCD